MSFLEKLSKSWEGARNTIDSAVNSVRKKISESFEIKITINKINNTVNCTRDTETKTDVKIEPGSYVKGGVMYFNRYDCDRVMSMHKDLFLQLNECKKQNLACDMIERSLNKLMEFVICIDYEQDKLKNDILKKTSKEIGTCCVFNNFDKLNEWMYPTSLPTQHELMAYYYDTCQI